MKRCSKCARDLPLGQFKARADRPHLLRSWCSECETAGTSKSRKEWRRHNRAAVQALKMKSGCADCGYRKHPEALQFDHVRGDKVADVCQLLDRPLEVVLAEIEKCEVVCANCHAIRTASRRQTVGEVMP